MVKLESVHGGHNNIAVGVRKGSYKEEVLADALAKRVAELTGARYIPQDKGDVNQNLAYFVREMDKKRGANLSIHFNAFNGSAHGTESFSYQGDSVGNSISTNMSKKVSDTLGTFNRGNKHAPLYVIDRSIDVTTLVEICFLDNDSDMKKYMAKREEVAHAIASCYDNYKGKDSSTSSKPNTKNTKKHWVKTGYYTEGYEANKKVKAYLDKNKMGYKTKKDDKKITYIVGWFGQGSSWKRQLEDFLVANNFSYSVHESEPK